jgi:hypothetical protein
MMKPLVACAFSCALLMYALAATAQPAPDNSASEEHSAEATANEQAGLPDLDAINRPNPASASAKVELNTTRQPSFYERDHSGTSITEYRDPGKVPEIDVHSNFGTNYQMSAPPDISPQVENPHSQLTRLPSIKLSY